MRPVSSWGRLNGHLHDVVSLNDPARVANQIATRSPGIAYGMGRSYGDVCLNPNGTLWRTTGLDHFVALDLKSGLLICEAGVLLRDIQRLSVPRGWILPVTPGTELVTVGGAIANDVHGKNHHLAGSFGEHVKRIKLVRTDGDIIECGPELNPHWFAATIGGLGLTGVIVEAQIQLRRTVGPWLISETIPYTSLSEFFRLADESEAHWEHTVSWIDCVSGGRGLFMRGRSIAVADRAEVDNREISIPIAPPFSLINRSSLRFFNAAYYRLKKRRADQSVVHYKSFLYPLDNVLEWNRIYGPKGFYQYQCVVPRDQQDAIQSLLKEIGISGGGSFLAVLKTFGDRQPIGMMSFPRPGVTLALDFPNEGERTLKLFERMDAVVREAGGRIYLAKDARMSRQAFEAGYPNLNDFLKYRDRGVSSGLSRRLMGN